MAPDEIKTLDEATQYLEGLINHERRPGFRYARLDLRAIGALLDAIGRPHDSLSIIHVAGSKGKGSTCLLTESILLALGASVGTFTSPHLESWVERFRVDGKSISEAKLAAAVARVRPAVESLRAGPAETQPSFFDATTAIAFLLFAEAGVDHAVVEVGLGGRLDSTNICEPDVTVITSIELEHTDKLGDTEALIAGEKAGIVKPGVPLILGELRPEAAGVIRARAAEAGASIRAFGEDFEVEVVEPEAGQQKDHSPFGTQRIRYRDFDALDFDCALAMSGRPAFVNAGIAIECVRALGRFASPAIADAAQNALARRRLPGRIEILRGDPEVVIDSAHTVESARALATVLDEIAPLGFDLLLSVSGDKNLAGVLDALLPKARRIWTTQAEPIRSLPAKELASEIRERAPDLEVESIDDPEAASLAARAALLPGVRLCATGSIYLAGIARRVLLNRAGRTRPPG